MNLHRTEKVPDWELIDPAARNHWQIIAAETNGFDTPGNRETLKGLVASLAGIWFLSKDKLSLAVGLLTYGRLQDIRDGAKAEATGTKSPLGEAFDATSDKIVMAAALPVLARKNILSKTEITGLSAQHGFASLATIYAKANARDIHPSKAGKLSTFGQWASLGLIGAGRLISNRNQNLSEGLDEAGHIGLKISLGLGAAATAGYAKEAFKPSPTT